MWGPANPSGGIMESARSTYDGWVGRDAYGPSGDKIGEIVDIYYDDATGRPEWVAVRTGLFGTKRTFVPIHGSQRYGDNDLQVAFDKDMIKGAPNIQPEGRLSSAEERELWSYYGYDYADTTSAKEYGYGTAYGQRRADSDYDWRRDDNDTVTRSEEELHVAKGRTERKETGKVRLRKYVVTENVKMEVPVTREEVRVTREPVSGPERTAGDGKIRSGQRPVDIGDTEREVVTYEERPVVTKETVPKERIRLDKETVTDTETVEDQVRKEKVDIEDDTRRPPRLPPRQK
jgi:uncharacterized protein (TIGR02271 family)